MAKPLSFDEAKALELYGQGLNDKQIADELHVLPSIIGRWRGRRGLRANHREPDGGTRPEVVVEIPPGLRSAREMQDDTPPEPAAVDDRPTEIVDTPTDQPDRPTDKDTNVPGKPRLAEVLGVEQTEKIRIVGGGYETDWFCIDQANGTRDLPCGAIVYAINHPESIIRAPRLTEPEIAIMRAVGAKWVSMDVLSYGIQVSLWSVRPCIVNGFYHGKKDSKNFGWIGDVVASLFPSLKQGDCIELEEGGK